MNNDLLKFIHPNENDKLLHMSGSDLQEFIVLLDEFYLELREQLGLEENITFGLELEFEYANLNKINEKLINSKLDDRWAVKRDISLQSGGEIASPILRDNKTTWLELQKVCEIINQHAVIDMKSAGHVHIGTHVLGAKPESWLNFIKLWSIYENIIFRFSYGNFLTARPFIKEYACCVARLFYRDYEVLKKHDADLGDIICRIMRKRLQAVNFSNVSLNDCSTFKERNTIEFRCPNGTLDPTIWQNNVLLFTSILKYATSSSFNEDILDARYIKNHNNYNGVSHRSIMNDLDMYNEIYLEQALELADMLFDNNLDKIYFLKQYLKSFEISDEQVAYPKKYALTKK